MTKIFKSHKKLYLINKTVATNFLKTVRKIMKIYYHHNKKIISKLRIIFRIQSKIKILMKTV